MTGRTHTVYECGSCGERFVGVRRCPECNLLMHALGVGGVCIHCDEPLLVAELLDDGSATLPLLNRSAPQWPLLTCPPVAAFGLFRNRGEKSRVAPRGSSRWDRLASRTSTDGR